MPNSAYEAVTDLTSSEASPSQSLITVTLEWSGHKKPVPSLFTLLSRTTLDICRALQGAVLPHTLAFCQLTPARYQLAVCACGHAQHDF